MKKQFLLLVLSLLSLNVFSQADTVQHITTGRKNSPAQEKKPYVIMISADGFRYDYAKKYKAEHLQQLAHSGVESASMIPSYPSVTFPNHYTLVTGLYPAHHGLVQNAFYDRKTQSFYSYKGKMALDPKWYGGLPLWVRAEQQHMLTASFYWVASEVPIAGIKPTYYYAYNEKIGIHERIQAVVNWLKLPAEKRPHLITLYFPQVDHAGHYYGPDAPETEKEVHFVDSAVNELNKAVKATGLPVNFVFVSDHGMTKIKVEKALPKPAYDTTKFILSGDGLLLELYAKNKTYINETYQQLKSAQNNYKVYLRSNMPAYRHYGEKDDWHDRIGDILLVPDWPYVFKLSDRNVNPGAHGFDPYLVREMHATFYAWGPAFKSHLQIASFPNVDVFPMVTKILGITYTDKVDGTRELAQKILK